MNNTLDRLLERELDEGETVLWKGQPDPKRYAVRAIPYVLSFIVIVLLFSALSFAAMHQNYTDMLLESQGEDHRSFLMFILGHTAFHIMLGILGLTQLAWLAIPCTRGAARRTLYALTDRRAIVLRSLRNGGVAERDYDLAELAQLRRVEDAHGSGNLYFEGARGAAMSRQTTTEHGFFAIGDVLGIERMIRGLTRGAKV